MDYEYIEKEIISYLGAEEDLKVDDFVYHPDDKNSIAFLVKRANELRARYRELMKDEENNKIEMEDIVIRAEMLLSGLVLFEFVEA